MKLSPFQEGLIAGTTKALFLFAFCWACQYFCNYPQEDLISFLLIAVFGVLVGRTLNSAYMDQDSFLREIDLLKKDAERSREQLQERFEIIISLRSYLDGVAHKDVKDAIDRLDKVVKE